MTTRERPADFRHEVGPGGLEVRTLASARMPRGLEARLAAEGDDDGAEDTAEDLAGPVISGYGSLYDAPTTLGSYYQWTEEVAAGAWTKTIQEGDIRSMFNHDTNWLLGRTKAGSLELAEDDTGLLYTTHINPDDANAMSVFAKVDRQDVDGSSVWFRVIREEWTAADDNTLEHRRILEAELFEVGPVVFPAFEDTTVEALHSLAPQLDSALRLFVPDAARRARRAAELLADPAAVAELRSFFEQDPELREAVCSCSTRAAEKAPGSTGTPPIGHLPLDIHLARARGLAALTGLPMKEISNA